jgi:threonine dehydratase
MHSIVPVHYRFDLPDGYELGSMTSLADDTAKYHSSTATAVTTEHSQALSYDTNEVHVARFDRLPAGNFKYMSATSGIASAKEAGHHEFSFFTAGSYGIGVGKALQELGGTATGHVPLGTNPHKIQAMREYGIDVREVGTSLEEAMAASELQAEADGSYLLHPSASMKAVAGVAILGKQLAEQVPDMTNIVIQYGGGSLASGIGSVIKELLPHVHVTIVQGEGSTSYIDAVRTGEVKVSSTVLRKFGGLAVAASHPLTRGIASHITDSVHEVSYKRAVATMHDYQKETGTLPEVAAAVGLEGARHFARKHNGGAKIVALLTGARPDPIDAKYLAAAAHRRSYSESNNRVFV